MRSLMVVGGFCCVLSVASARAADKEITYVNLQPKANQKLTDNFHAKGDGSWEGNNLAELPRGEQTFEGVKFKIEEGLLQLGSTLLKNKPEKIEAIKIDKAFAKLHILHATGFGSPMNDRIFVADNTLIGEYKVHYEDKSTETIPIVYGKDVRNWWNSDNSKEITRSKLAWEGTNEKAKQFDVMIRLYLSTWKNPKPEMKVTRIDYLSTNETVAAPFCVAITLAGK